MLVCPSQFPGRCLQKEPGECPAIRQPTASAGEMIVLFTVCTHIECQAVAARSVIHTRMVAARHN